MDQIEKNFSAQKPLWVTDVKDGNFPQQTDPVKFRPYEKVDIAIIGGGFVGASAGLQLTKIGNYRVALLDAAHIGSGASGKSMGHVVLLQAPPDKIIAHCGRELGDRLIAAGQRSRQLVRNLIDTHQIDCDLRDRYIWIDRQGNQRIETGNDFGIDPYPYVLGLVNAAREKGLRVFEETLVSNISCQDELCRLYTDRGIIDASYVIAAGGHQMAETIPVLAHLRNRTTELFVTTLRTEPLPPEVLRAIMPAAEGNPCPFSNEEVDVSDGITDQYGRLSFNARVAAAPGRTDLERIYAELDKMFPNLRASFRSVTGRDLVVQPNIKAEPINFTKELLPSVGIAGSNRRILYVDALGGHGIAAGTFLGEAAAEKIHGLLTGNPRLGTAFDDFASIRHLGSRLMRINSFRRAMGEAGVFQLRAPEYVDLIKQRIKFMTAAMWSNLNR